MTRAWDKEKFPIRIEPGHEVPFLTAIPARKNSIMISVTVKRRVEKEHFTNFMGIQVFYD